jgi:hypothetical protein
MVVFQMYYLTIKEDSLKKKNRVSLKNKRDKYEYSKELFISNRDIIEENVLKTIKKDNISSKND